MLFLIQGVDSNRIDLLRVVLNIEEYKEIKVKNSTVITGRVEEADRE